MIAARRALLPLLIAALLAALVTLAGLPFSSSATAGASAVSLPAVGHVFVINLENKSYATTWGASSPAPYLSKTLRSQGVLLTNYYGIGHNSLDNYIAQLSGQGPSLETQGDCQVYTDFIKLLTISPGQAVGQGCVFPRSVPTLAGQLSAAGRTWKGYMEDMRTPCRHPALNALDSTQTAHVGDQYAARHNPFVYFHSITDSPACAANVVDLAALPQDLAAQQTTANLTYITPNLCNDGHDAPCVDGKPGGLTSANLWLQTWVPRIMSSPAFQHDGVLIITFDEADSFVADASACCGEGAGVNTLLPGLTGLGGGRVGALVLSKWVTPGTTSATPYNHYSLLGSLENLFGLGHLGYAAQPGLAMFGNDVFNAPR